MNLASSLVISGAGNNGATAQEHVVFALSTQERHLFLPGWEQGLHLAAKQSWVDTDALNPQQWLDILRQLRPSILVTAWSCPVLPLEWAQDEKFPLRYVCSITGSVKPRVPRQFIERGILVSNWGNLISHTVAEHALLMTLACLRNLPLWPEFMTQPLDSVFKMMKRLKSRDLRGKRVGLHGFGSIARELVLMLKPHQVILQAYSHGVPQSLFDEYGVHACSSLKELFQTSDVLLECEGLNDWSKGSVTEELLRLLPSEAVFVNVGRGALVADEQVLVAMAKEGRLRVGLDVYHHEPLPADSPLRGQPEILLSPHIAGATWDTYPFCGLQALENVQRFLRGEEPVHLVTPEIYDRAT